ncbi:PXA domain-containing protein [Rhodotorula paludigena]|uniref:PXA domain-containing protein n=1 Tax=Rhodotorula paludigena TaxID=86838 RepID=UPI00317A7CA6
MPTRRTASPIRSWETPLSSLSGPSHATPSSAPLHQRILLPSSATATKLPRILHSSAHSTLDPLLLDLIALALRAYVTPWYNGSISRDPDKDFLRAVTTVLVHSVQALEVRLAALDWVQLVTRDVPDLLTAHYGDWDIAHERAEGKAAERLFDHLQSHLAVSLSAPCTESTSTPTSPIAASVDKVYLRTLVDQLLKLLLPPEDLHAETERAIVREILVGVVFGTIYNRVAQPWFLHGLIAKQLEAHELQRHKTPATDSLAQDGAPAGPAGIAGMISNAGNYLVSAVAAVFSFALSGTSTSPAGPPIPKSPIHESFLALVRAVLPRSALLDQILRTVSLPLFLLSTPLDALVSSFVRTRLATESTARVVLDGAIRGMFPNEGWPAPKEEDPDDEGREDLKRRCEEALARALPESLPGLLFPSLPTSSEPSDSLAPRLRLARHLLRPLASHTANVHLFVSLIDLVVGKVFPELVVAPVD